jgi:transposase
MFYLDIDVGKSSHAASLIDDSGKILFKAFSFSNSTNGGNSLLETLSKHVKCAADMSIGMEATGHYWLSLYSFLIDNGYLIHVINPIQTDGWRKGTEIRKRKTDTIDSVLIAELMRYGSFVETSLADENLFSLRNLTRLRTYLVDSISDLKRKVICVLDQVFPEYESVFSNVFGATSKELLLSYTTPGELETLSVANVKHFFTSYGKQFFLPAVSSFLHHTVRTSLHCSVRSFLHS